MLSRDDIRKAMVNGEIKIYPFSPKNLTGIGYNLTTTHFAFSINQGILLTVYSRTEKNRTTHFIKVPPNDTILLFSKEYIEVGKEIAGTFHSKVARVSEGLGHLSTTLDPTWKGQLLLSINNPSSKPITLDLDGDGNIVTLLFYRLDSPVSGEDIHDNNKGRCELLIAHFSEDFQNKVYHEKHLELKEFIECELASSLNGEGDFLKDNNSVVDSYTKKVDILLPLLTRMQNDRIQIQEGKYLLGEEGFYSVFHSEQEEKAFFDCELYKLKEKSDQEAPAFREQLLKKHTILSNFRNDLISMLEKCISIISFELGQINHIRRIEWHNSRVQSFAGATSELVLVREKAQRKKNRRRKFWFVGIGCLACGALAGYFLITNPDIQKVLLVLITAIVSPLLAKFVSWLTERSKRE